MFPFTVFKSSILASSSRPSILSTPPCTGFNCEVDIDECASDPCLHGECVDLVAMYECKCHPGKIFFELSDIYFPTYILNRENKYLNSNILIKIRGAKE